MVPGELGEAGEELGRRESAAAGEELEQRPRFWRRPASNRDQSPGGGCNPIGRVRGFNQ